MELINHIDEHIEVIKLRFRGVEGGVEEVLGAPLGLPFGFDFGWVVAGFHCLV